VISQRIDTFYQIIFAVANYFGQGVADIHAHAKQVAWSIAGSRLRNTGSTPGVSHTCQPFL